MKSSDRDIGYSNNDWFSLYQDDGERNEPDDLNNPAPPNKNTDSIKNPCDIYIESKYIRIVKHKATTPIVQKLERIHTDLCSPHNPLLISKKS